MSEQKPSAKPNTKSDAKPNDGRATRRPDHVKAPKHWEKSDAPKPAPKEAAPALEPLDPVRYGDWEKNGIAVDF